MIEEINNRVINELKMFHRFLNFVESGDDCDDGREKDRKQSPGIVRIQRF